MELENKDDDLNTLEGIFILVDSLSEKELTKLKEYIEEQFLIVKVSDRRKSALRNELRSERIRMKKELKSSIQEMNEKFQEEEQKISLKKKNKKY